MGHINNKDELVSFSLYLCICVYILYESIEIINIQDIDMSVCVCIY